MTEYLSKCCNASIYIDTIKPFCSICDRPCSYYNPRKTSEPTTHTTKDGQTIESILDSLVNFVGGNSTAKKFTIKDAERAIAAYCAERERLAVKALHAHIDDSFNLIERIQPG